jgi:hypothetical protein
MTLAALAGFYVMYRIHLLFKEKSLAVLFSKYANTDM